MGSTYVSTASLALQEVDADWRASRYRPTSRARRPSAAEPTQHRW